MTYDYINIIDRGPRIEAEVTSLHNPYQRFRELTDQAKLIIPHIMTPQEQYLQGHRASSFKVGDRVRVTRKAASYENGWQNIWTVNMTNQIGNILTIDKDEGESGFHMGEYFSYPYFILEHVNTMTTTNTTPAKRKVVYAVRNKTEALAAVQMFMMHGYNLTPLVKDGIKGWYEGYADHAKWVGLNDEGGATPVVTSWSCDHKPSLDCAIESHDIDDLDKALRAPVEPVAPKIHGYDGKLGNGIITFGCAEIPTGMLRALHETVLEQDWIGNRNIVGITFNSGKSLSKTDIKSIIDYVDAMEEYRKGQVATSPIAKGHNPDNLTEEQVGVKDGWRLLTIEEIRKRYESRVTNRDIEGWYRPSQKFTEPRDWLGNDDGYTYRTKQPAGYYLTH